jgi:hypothetical protein
VVVETPRGEGLVRSEEGEFTVERSGEERVGRREEVACSRRGRKGDGGLVELGRCSWVSSTETARRVRGGGLVVLKGEGRITAVSCGRNANASAPVYIRIMSPRGVGDDDPRHATRNPAGRPRMT